MPGLLDIAPPEVVTETVTIRGEQVVLRALRNREQLILARRFASIQRSAAKFNGTSPGEELSPEALSAIVSSDDAVESLDMIAAAIAMSIDMPGLETEAEIHKRLSDAEAQQCFAVIMRLTHGPRPLAGSPATAGLAGNGVATDSPRPSSN